MRWNIVREKNINSHVFLHREGQHRGPPAGVCTQDITCTEHNSGVVVCGGPELMSSSSSSSSQIINVDWVHVESRAGDIAKSDKGVQLVLGQLIDE